MLDHIKRFFDTRIMAPSSADTAGASVRVGEVAEHEIRLATAALLIEMARADDQLVEGEMQAVTDSVQMTFELSDDECQALLELAEEEVRQSASLFDFTRLVDRGFTNQQKIHVVELLWRVAYSDNHLDKYEEHLLRKLADLLHVSHQDFLKAKHRIQAGVAELQGK
ncbi:MAG: hypothetical protein BMS9Abin26_0852 [Gammaproteobacteria bacterium]|nr:MAG: hypothetical protein BMS9Abin26_0852 [Gammaproteobacteria bacterium]